MNFRPILRYSSVLILLTFLTVSTAGGAASGGTLSVIDVPAGDAAALIAAVNTANGNGEADTIVLGGGTYTYAAPNNYWYGPNALPAISSVILIEGNGSIIQRDPASSTPNFRLFYVDGGLSGLTAGTLTLRNLTIQGGYAKGGDSGPGGGGLGAGGGIFNQGTLVLENVTFSGNTAHGGNGATGTAHGGGGIGQDAQDDNGGGFGGPFPGGAGGAGGSYTSYAGGGGGGFSAPGAPAVDRNGGNGGGLSALGGDGGTLGSGHHGGLGGDGGGGGDGGCGSVGFGNSGGAFGYGGLADPFELGGGGGGGVGGGGAGSMPGCLTSRISAGGGGFGGGGGYGNWHGATGGFGGGGGDYGNPGFGGGDSGWNAGGGGAGMGGAVFNMYGAVTMTSCTFTGNAATGGTGGGAPGSGLGGGLFNLDGMVVITDSAITSNSGTSGTALYNLAYANTVSGGAATAAMTVSNSTATDLVNNQDRSKNGADVASVILITDGTGPTNVIPNGVTNLGGASQTGTAATGCFSDIYGDPAGNCSGHYPCYTHLWRLYSFVCDGGTVSLSGAVYTEPLILDRNLTVNLGGNIEFPGSITQNSGALNATSGTWTVRGDLLLNGATFNPGGGTVVFAGSGSQSVAGSGTLPLANALVGDGCWGYWKFDEGSGTLAGNWPFYDRLGTLSGTTGWSTDAAPVSLTDIGSLQFHGAGGTDESVTISGTPGTSAYTIAAWVRQDDSNSRNIITMTDADGPMAHWSQQLRTNGGHFEHYLWDSSGTGSARSVTSTTIISPGTWTHVAAVATTGGLMYLYVNGQSEGTPQPVGAPQDFLDRLVIGSPSGGGFSSFNGLIDELRIFPRALSAQDVLKLYTSDIEAWWKLDEGSGAGSFADATGHGHAGSCSGSSCPAAGQPGVSGTALAFDGTNDSITVPWDSTTVPYTLAVWVKPSDTLDRDIIVRTSPLGPNANWSEQIRTSSGRFQHYLYDGNTRTVTGSTIFVPGTWYHLAAVATPGGSMKLYVNGVSEGTPLIIGTPQGGLDRYMLGAASNGISAFSGLMDEPRFFKRALIASEVAALASGKHLTGPINTVTLGQALDVSETIALSDAALDVGTGSQPITTHGDWLFDAGVFKPHSGTVTFNKSGGQWIIGDTAFWNVVVASSSILRAYDSDVGVEGTLSNYGWTDERKTITGAGSRASWGLAGITTEVTTPGTLSGLRVLRRDQSQPNAPPGLQTGKYWSITPTGSGYSVNLTLPHNGLTDPQVCGYESGRWDWGRSASTATTVTRDGVTAFSDWTVGSGVPSPPMAGNGMHGTTAAMFTKHAPGSEQIDVTFDAAHCSSASGAIILYGALGNFTGYAGTAQCNGGNSGETTIEGSAVPDSVWFNVVWTNATIAGHPGFAFDGVAELARTWTAGGRCGITSDRQDHSVCP